MPVWSSAKTPRSCFTDNYEARDRLPVSPPSRAFRDSQGPKRCCSEPNHGVSELWGGPLSRPSSSGSVLLRAAAGAPQLWRLGGAAPCRRPRLDNDNNESPRAASPAAARVRVIETPRFPCPYSLAAEAAAPLVWTQSAAGCSRG